MMAEMKRDHVPCDDVDQDGMKKRNYKMLVDPQIKKGEEKLLRYDGILYNTDNHGQGVVVLRDPRPRMNRLWSRRERAELPVPRYKVDEWYVGAVPPREVTFSRLNDNITKQFMEKMCSKFGKLERVRVYHHPKTQKHMGLSKIVFTSIKSAGECVKKLHMTSVMGNVIHAQIDCKGEILNKLYQRIVKGEMMAETIPDVIRHTQDGITMSNKYKEHNHHHSGRKERRKSSQDDPRRLRRSTDTRPKASANSSGHVHEPLAESANEECRKGQQNEKPSIADNETNDVSGQSSHNTAHTVVARAKAEDKGSTQKSGCESERLRNSVDEDCPKSSKSNRVWSTDLESRISMLLSEQTKKYNLDDAPASNRDENQKPVTVKSDTDRAPDAIGNNVPDKRRTKKEKRKKRRKSHDSGKAIDSDSSSHKRSHDTGSDLPEDAFLKERLIRSPMIETRRRTLSPPPHDDLRSPRDRSLPPPPGRFRHEGPEFDPGYPHRDIDFGHEGRRGIRSPRSPRRISPPYYDRPPQHYDGPHHDRRRYSPPYGRHSPRRHSPGYERHRRMKREYPERGNMHREYDRYEFRDDPGFPSHRPHPDFHYRRRGSPPRMPRSPRRPRLRSSERWISPDRFPDRMPHPQRPVSPRMVYYGRSTSRDRSPGFGRRSPERHCRPVRFTSPVERGFRGDRRSDIDQRCHQPHSPEREQHSTTEKEGEVSDMPRIDRETNPVKRNSKDFDSPKLSLDQRLKQMTGEEGETKENPSQQLEIKTEVKDDKASSRSDGSSVDMEISEGESEGEKMARANATTSGRNAGLQKVEPAKQELWQEFNKLPWNGFGPPVGMPPGPDARMWNGSHQNFFKGFSRDARFPYLPIPAHFSLDRWPDRFHPGVPHPEMHPFNMHPNMQYQPAFPGDAEQAHFNMMSEEDMQKRMEDQELCNNVLGDVIRDLKAIVSRDLNKKVIETMAFKVYESWWDENKNRKKVVNKPLVPSSLSDAINVVTESAMPDDSQIELKALVQAENKANKNLLNAFDPLNWAKNSFEMDGFRIGLGLRSAISKMPSFRVKKRQRTPTPPPETVAEAEKGTTARVKKRRLQNRDNEENEMPRHPPKDKKLHHRRIAALDSEGEDEDDHSDDMESENSSDDGDSKEPKYKVLDVDEIFSGSSDSEDEEDSENGSDNSENDLTDSESDVPQVEKALEIGSGKRDVSVSDSEEDKIKEMKESLRKSPLLSVSDKEKESTTNSERELPERMQNIPLTLGHDTSMAVSLLSPTAPSITGNVLTPQQLRHIHPKKRHRLISQDHANFDTIPKIPEKFRSDDELSSMSDKEKAALEALTDMQMTPDRRLSSQSSDSSLLPPTSSPTSPTKTKKICLLKGSDLHEPELKPVQPTPCPSHELEAVAAAALISIRKSIPPISPPMLDVKSPVPRQSSNLTPRKHAFPLLSSEDKVQMAELAEEHNYFVPSYSPRHVHPSTDPVVAQILEEHSYSRACLESGNTQYTDRQKGSASLTSASTLSAESIFNFEDDSKGEHEIISAAERVKLRREQSKQKQSSKKRIKKEKWLHKETDYRVPPRTEVQELMTLYEMWHDGLDLEDMKYLREVYEAYLEKSNSPTWVNDSHWVPHPVTNVPDASAKNRRKRKRGKEGKEDGVHKTGCARTEGYYQLEDKVKLKQRRKMYGHDKPDEAAGADRPPGLHHNSELTGGAQNSSDLCKNLGSRETRHFMRRIASEVGADVGDLFKYNQLMFRKKAVKFKRSSIHGWGLFAQEAIGADEMVIEYVGQVVRTLVAERREVHYTELGIGSSYLFRIDSDYIIDATKCGNYARFMNHSCNPSCYAKVITVDTVKKIVIYSKGPIKKSDEITYDYKFPLEDDKIVCYCGAENCRRTLN